VSRHIPKWGAGVVYDQQLSTDLGPEGQSRGGTSLTKGQILWLRGITRLQTQVCKKIDSHWCRCRLISKIRKKNIMHLDIYIYIIAASSSNSFFLVSL
jgi:hypothetical protein